MLNFITLVKLLDLVYFLILFINKFSRMSQITITLGRYPIHFHMNGDMPSSFVSECSIHESFNRAVNIHASNYILVERTVIYNIMGGAFFLEDGVEIGNTLQYNLAIFVRSSSSLLNEDTTPGSYCLLILL